MDPNSDAFITLLTSSQVSIYASILVMLPDRNSAHDVLQETNLTLFHKAAEFEEGTDFLAWAYRIAHFHVLNYRKRMQRERLIFDEPFLATLAQDQVVRASETSRKGEALRNCLSKLPQAQRELISSRYASGGSVQRLADEQKKSVGSISQTLYRIRRALLQCIDASLQSEAKR